MNVTSILDRSILSHLREGERTLLERLDRIIALLEGMQESGAPQNGPVRADAVKTAG